MCIKFLFRKELAEQKLLQMESKPHSS